MSLAWGRAALARCLPASLFGRLACLLVLFALASHVLTLGLLFELRPAAAPHGPGSAAELGRALLAWPGAGHPPPPHSPHAPHPPPPSPPGWPPGLHPGLLLDIALRVAALLLAARIAAGWLSRPIQRLASAAQAFGQSVGAGPGQATGAALGHRLPVCELPEDGPRELRDAARVFNHMQATIRQQWEERDRFVAAVSHDLRTPLTRLRLRTESVSDATQRLHLRRDIREMELMIRATLDHLRGAADAEPWVALDVHALADALAEDQQACGHDVRLLGQTRPLRAQASALRRCLGNLVDNALRYAGQARIRLIDHDDALCIEVEDDGPGLPEAELTKVLAPFYRVDASRNPEHGGLGLGLAIAHDIARQHGGSLVLSNRAEGGLVARLRLPR